MAVIELAKPGQEATTYELLVTVGNAAILVNGIIATQLLTAFNGIACGSDDDAAECSSNTVDTSCRQAFDNSQGPKRFTHYTLVLNSISIGAVLLVVTFLPRNKEDCHEWKEVGEKLGTSERRGLITLAMVAVTLIVS